MLRGRTAEAEDAAVLSGLALRSKAVWGYSEDFMARCREELTLTPNQLEEDWGYLYEDADAAGSERVVGFVLVSRCSRDRLQQFPEAISAGVAFEVEALFVEPQRLGQGVGKRLFEKAREYAARVSPTGELWIQSDPNAEAFYLRCGAVRVGELESASVRGRWLPLLRSSW
ncbi:MAG: GNAT family N-acetyltransferase [Polyangiaceae bacterium]|nr:GNAT family N-acetyltransferase [Polyangiaceae bacterium]